MLGTKQERWLLLDGLGDSRTTTWNMLVNRVEMYQQNGSPPTVDWSSPTPTWVGAVRAVSVGRPG